MVISYINLQQQQCERKQAHKTTSVFYSYCKMEKYNSTIKLVYKYQNYIISGRKTKLEPKLIIWFNDITCDLSHQGNISADLILTKWRIKHGSETFEPQFNHFYHKPVCDFAVKNNFNEE